jgi:hypothetical protein
MSPLSPPEDENRYSFRNWLSKYLSIKYFIIFLIRFNLLEDHLIIFTALFSELFLK